MKRQAEESLRFFLEKREQDLSLRTLADKSHLVDFCSNDYLGLSRSALLQQKIEAKLKTYHQVGSTGSRLISGNSVLAEQLEDKIADYHNSDAGLLFNSGYDANVGLFSSVPQPGDLVLADELVHASIRDGIKMGRAEAIFFEHNNLDELKGHLQLGTYKNVFVVVESVYSMDGDFSPLNELAELAKTKGINLIVDEAHATGIFGDKGEGRVVELGLEKEVFARVITFGKALGCNGAIVLSSNIVKQFLINYARSFIFTTALPVYSLICIDSVYDMLSIINHKRVVISNILTLFKQKLNDNVLSHIISSSTPILSLLVPGNEAAKQLSSQIEAAGFYAKAILYPTVPKGKERLRFCFHSFNTNAEVEQLASVLNKNYKA